MSTVAKKRGCLLEALEAGRTSREGAGKNTHLPHAPALQAPASASQPEGKGAHCCPLTGQLPWRRVGDRRLDLEGQIGKLQHGRGESVRLVHCSPRPESDQRGTTHSGAGGGMARAPEEIRRI